MTLLVLAGDAFTPPPAIWPAEWITFTNITREGYASDYGTQIYSWNNRAQIVLHSDWFAYSDDDLTGGKGSMLWIDDVAYRLGNNNQECCLLDQYQFTMPNIGWLVSFVSLYYCLPHEFLYSFAHVLNFYVRTDLLTYEYSEIMNGVPCYVYTNKEMMDAKYWQSIESGLPIAWSNTPDPNNPNPIVQYFFSTVTYDLPLPSSYFAVPTTCKTAVSCYDDSSSVMNSKYIDDSMNSSSDSGVISISYGVFSGICISLLVFGASSTYFFQYLYRSRKPIVEGTTLEKQSENTEDNSMMYNLLAGSA